MTLTHGTNNTYNRYGCRCQPCREARRIYMAATRAHAKRLKIKREKPEASNGR